MKNKATGSLALLMAFFVYGGQVQAHTFGTEGAGFLAGVAHPFIGLDHWLAMLAVGVWAGQLGGRALWLIPLAFVGMLSLSAVMAAYGPVLPWLEMLIAASVLILGGLVFSSVRLSAGLGALLMAALAISHGYAHGLEMPEAASAVLYGGGFVLSTVVLHGLGLVLGLVIRSNIWLARSSGFAIALTGLYLTAAAV